MAIIDRLFIQTSADTISEDGNILTAEVPWIMILDSSANVVQANNILNLQGPGYGFPLQGQRHPDNPSLVFVNKTVDHFEGNQGKFIIIANYTNFREDIDRKSSSDPLDLPTSYSFEQVDRNVTITIDAVTKKPITNSAGKPLLGITENKPLTRFIIVRNERRFSTKETSLIRNTVNSVPTKIDGETFDKGTLKLESITASKQFDQDDREYYVVTYKVLENPDSFVRKIADRGRLNKLGNAPGNLVAGSDGAAYLDGEGLYLPPDAEIVYNEVNTLKMSNWSGLRLQWLKIFTHTEQKMT